MKLQSHEIGRIEMISQSQEDGISLAQGALRIGGVSPIIRSHASAVLTTDRADYYGNPQGLPELRVALADYLSHKYNATISISQILIGHGSMGALSSTLIHLLDDGDEVILPEPCYPVFRAILQTTRGQIKPVAAYVRHDNETESKWEFNINAIKSAITPKTKLLLLANPNNPIGHILSTKELESLIELAETHRFNLVVDEAYEDYIFENQFQSATQYISKSEYVFRTGTFSKGYGMSGWRVGYILGPNEPIREAVNVNSALYSSANILGQHAALKALSHTEILDLSRRMVAAGRIAILKALKPLADDGRISFTPPAGGFSVFCKINGQDDTTTWVHDMVHAVKLAVVNGAVFGPNHKQYVRLCYARPVPMIIEGIKRLKKFLE